MRLPAGGRIKKLCENTLLSWDDISPLANYYQVTNNCMVYTITSYMQIYDTVSDFCNQSPSTSLPGSVVEWLIRHLKPLNRWSIAEINGDRYGIVVNPFTVCGASVHATVQYYRARVSSMGVHRWQLHHATCVHDKMKRFATIVSSTGALRVLD